MKQKFFSLFNLDTQQITKDISKITTIKNLPDDVATLKPGKGNEIMILDINNYRTSVKHFFDASKIRAVENDPKFTRLDSLQNHFPRLKVHNEISEELCKRISPKNERPAKAYGLLKIQKYFAVLPKFRPITDTEIQHFSLYATVLARFFNHLLSMIII